MHAKYYIRELEKKDYDAWDKFVDDTIGGTIFHKSYWLKSTDLPFKIVGIFNKERLEAGFTLSVQKNKIRQEVIVNPYLTPYCGLIYRKEEIGNARRISKCKEISNILINYTTQRYKNISLKMSPAINDLQPFIWSSFKINLCYTYILGISDLNACWTKYFSSIIRRNIKKAQKDGLYIKLKEDFEDVLLLSTKTFERQNMSNKAKKLRRYGAPLFNELKNRGLCRNFVCYDSDDKPIGCSFIVWDTKRCYYLMGGYDHEKSHPSASTLAMWEAIQFASKDLGLREFDFEGSMLEPVERFFRSFGGTLTPYYQVTRRSKLNALYQKIAKFI